VIIDPVELKVPMELGLGATVGKVDGKLDISDDGAAEATLVACGDTDARAINEALAWAEPAAAAERLGEPSPEIRRGLTSTTTKTATAARAADAATGPRRRAKIERMLLLATNRPSPCVSGPLACRA
jgi:hypothetical protein